MRVCQWCGDTFTLTYRPKPGLGRFCGRSCSAKWRMRQPEIVAKVHAPHVAEKRGRARAAWLATPGASGEIERMRTLGREKKSAEKRARISARLRSIGHRPSIIKGNGHGLTVPQRMLLETIGTSCVPEFAISLGPRTPGYPTCYKVDLALPKRMVAIEVDGSSHRAVIRQAADAKRDAALRSRGWIVVRYRNEDVLDWDSAGRHPSHPVSVSLAAVTQ